VDPDLADPALARHPGVVRVVTTSIPTAGGTTDGPAGPRRTGEHQPWSWHLNRAATLLLVLLVPLHFAVTFLVDDLGAPARVVSARLEDPTWRMLTWLTIALALVHATVSADAALRVRRPGRGGAVATAAIGLVAGVVLASATFALATR
jgi:succinate dehydrogenase hydrophobic anchor subunit